MRKLIAWPMFLLTYYGGHLAFLVIDMRVWEGVTDREGSFGDRVFSAIYQAYQGGMRWSVFWSDWADLKQWTPANEKP